MNDNINPDDYLGKHFKDKTTGFEGICTGVSFFLTGCARMCLATLHEATISEYWIDQPMLIELDAQGSPVTLKAISDPVAAPVSIPGGPKPPAPRTGY